MYTVSGVLWLYCFSVYAVRGVLWLSYVYAASGVLWFYCLYLYAVRGELCSVLCTASMCVQLVECCHSTAYVCMQWEESCDCTIICAASVLCTASMCMQRDECYGYTATLCIHAVTGVLWLYCFCGCVMRWILKSNPFICILWEEKCLMCFYSGVAYFNFTLHVICHTAGCWEEDKCGCMYVTVQVVERKISVDVCMSHCKLLRGR